VYVILTSKPGKFRTELGAGLCAVEAYDYLFYGKKCAHFVIAELLHELKVTVIDEAEPPTVNQVPSKFLEKFSHVDAARRELQHLTRFGSMQTALVRTDLPSPA
jgi:hypothetical protein